MKTEIIISIIIVGILGVFLNPTHFLMPDSVNMMLILVLILGFLGFVGLFWREQPNDERDAAHMHKAGRISFLVGAAILVVGIVVQALEHEIDAWLLYALAGMVLTKFISRIFHKLRDEM